MVVEKMRERKRKTKREGNGNEKRRWKLHDNLNQKTVKNG